MPGALEAAGSVAGALEGVARCMPGGVEARCVAVSGSLGGGDGTRGAFAIILYNSCMLTDTDISSHLFPVRVFDMSSLSGAS